MSRGAFQARMGATLATDERSAVEEIRAQLDSPDAATVLVFCSNGYDLRRLGAELRSAFPGVVYGCTGAGQIGPNGYQIEGLTAVSLSGDLRVTPYTIQPLQKLGTQEVTIRRALAASLGPQFVPGRAFGFVLIDGLSQKEERVVSSLHALLGEIPLIGGSAGEHLGLRATHVLTEEGFVQDAAVLLLFETSLPFRTFKVQHFVPTSAALVVTAAEPDRRLVTEINGKPASEEYARLIGASPGALDAGLFSQHPVMLKVGDDHYVRSIQGVGEGGSLRFFCAIDEGLVLRLGRAEDILEATRRSFEAGGHPPEIILGCDCVLRRLEVEQRGLTARMNDLFVQNRVVGFCSYGEQYDGVHANQTFTGIALG